MRILRQGDVFGVTQSLEKRIWHSERCASRCEGCIHIRISCFTRVEGIGETPLYIHTFDHRPLAGLVLAVQSAAFELQGCLVPGERVEHDLKDFAEDPGRAQDGKAPEHKHQTG